MTKRIWLLTLLSMLLVGLVVIAGCGGDDDDDPVGLNLTGTWTIVAVGYPNMTAVLTHTGTTITGTVTTVPAYATGITGFTNGPSGTTRPREVTLVVTFSDGMVGTFTGTVSDDNTRMSGTYQNTQNQSDSWSATKQAL